VTSVRVLTALSLLAALPAAAQEPAPAGPKLAVEATWVVRLHGEEVGRERVHQSDAEAVRSSAKLQLPKAPPFSYVQTVTLGEAGPLVRYELTSDAIQASATMEANRLAISRTYEGGGTGGLSNANQQRTCVVLDHLVFAHYDVLARLAVAKGEAFRVTVAIPQQARILEARFEPLPLPEADPAGVLRGRLVLGPKEHVDLTYDGEGRALAVELPSRGLSASVEGFEAEAARDEPAWVEAEVTVPAPEGAPVPGYPGVFTRPRDGELLATALVIPRGGAVDRDGAHGPGARPYRDLARELAGAGVATLRLDNRAQMLQRRFFDASTRTQAAEELERLQPVSAGVADARAALAWLAARAPEAPRFLVGHEQGGLVALELAQGESDLAGLILWATPGRAYDEVILDRLAAAEVAAGGQRAFPAARAALAKQHGPAFARVRAGTLPAGERLLGAGAASWADLLPRDPAALARGVEAPVGLVQGTHDAQVAKADYEALRAALLARDGGFTGDTWVEGANHLLIRTPDGSGRAYVKRRPGRMDAFGPVSMASWMRSVLRPR
jgi:alpha-beta hydrolase superfamily lysophospholipase